MADVQELTMNSPTGDIQGLGKKTLALFTQQNTQQLYNSTSSNLQDRLTAAICKKVKLGPSGELLCYSKCFYKNIICHLLFRTGRQQGGSA